MVDKIIQGDGYKFIVAPNSFRKMELVEVIAAMNAEFGLPGAAGMMIDPSSWEPILVWKEQL